MHQDRLEKHLKFECNPESKSFQCPKCKSGYNHRTNLLRHLKFECGVMPKFVCHLCTRSFKHKHHLQRHLLSH